MKEALEFLQDSEADAPELPPGAFLDPDPVSARQLQNSEADAPLVLPMMTTSGDGVERRLLRGPREPHSWDVTHMVPDSDILWLMIAIFAMIAGLLLMTLCVAEVLPGGSGSELRRWVEGLLVLSATDVEAALQHPSRLLAKPQGAVRIEGRVVASPNFTLRAPMTRRSCVVFSASAGERRLDGIVEKPMAFHAMNCDFDIVPIRPADSELRIRVRGQDVALFDVVGGHHEEGYSSLGDAPEFLQDFVRTHRAAAQLPEGASEKSSRAERSSMVEFCESILEVGAVATFVGELRHTSTGQIGLWPLLSASSPAIVGGTPTSGGLTSWETVGLAADAQVEKVMVSDDRHLLSTRGTPQKLASASGRSWLRAPTSPVLRATSPAQSLPESSGFSVI